MPPFVCKLFVKTEERQRRRDDGELLKQVPIW